MVQLHCYRRKRRRRWWLAGWVRENGTKAGSARLSANPGGTPDHDSDRRATASPIPAQQELLAVSASLSLPSTQPHLYQSRLWRVFQVERMGMAWGGPAHCTWPSAIYPRGP